jgi:amino acid adenylation domain-containing protein
MKIKDIYPLTPLQEGIYFHWKISKSMYFEQSSYKIQGELHINYLKESYDNLIARHDVLRTCFLDNVGEDLIQIVQNEVPSNFEYLDITENAAQTIESVKQDDIAKSFDLTKGSQMRLTVLKTSENQYELIWSHHHIIMDGWCIGILIAEFFAIYEGLFQGKKNTLPKATSYSDYVKWLMKNDKEKSLHYWDTYLEGFQGANTLPFHKKNTDAYSPGEIFYTVSGDLRDQLAAFCQQNSITENVFFQTLWGILLAKYNNTNDVVFGGVVSGRPAEIHDVAKIIGLFINTIPVRISFDNQTTIKQILLQTQEQAIQSLPYHYQSISEIQLKANGNQPLFDHILVFENYLVAEAIASELSENEKTNIILLETEFYEGENYDFSLAIIPGKEISIRFTFNAEKYANDNIENLKNHFEQVLTTALENFDLPVSEIEFLKESEKEAILSISGHDTLKDTPQEHTLVELFETVAQEKQDNIALVYGKNQYSFAALNTIADQFASFLKEEYKVQKGDFIALQLDRSDWLVIALLGIFKAGGVYVPLDVNLPQDRVDYIIEDTNCTIVVNAAFINRFKASPKTDLIVSAEVITPSDLAYLIYTSGSTGKPKGVLVEHRNIAALFINVKENFLISQEPVMPLLASNSFDIFLFELFHPLLAGGKVVMVPNEEIKDMPALAKILSQINSFHAVPTLMRAVIDHIKANKTEKLYRHIEAIFIGGDKIPAGILEEIRVVFANATINVLYGPTEGSIFITTESYLPNVKQFPNAVIGKSNAHNAAYVLDDNLKLCPFYSIGELCISGNQVTRGYLNKAEITAEKFIQNPFKSDEKLYRTGDMVRKLPNGKIEFVGRKDNQVKVRGFRIELEEIENALLSHEHVEFAIAKTITLSGEEKEIVAYIKATKEMGTQELILFLKGILPPFMVPDYFVQLEEIPLTINGKLDAKKLPHPLNSNNSKQEAYIQAETETEIKLTEIWERILNRKTIGINDNFFHLGGHSLKIIKLSNQIFVNLGVHINIKEIYAHNTIKQQALFIDSSLHTYTTSIPKAEIAPSYPLSSSQYRLWNVCSIDPEANKAYNIRLIDVKNIVINTAALTQALHSILERHEILRTAFITNENGEPGQIIIPIEKVEPLKIHHLDLRKSEALEQDLEIALTAIGDVCFNLETAPLMKVGLINLQDDKSIISVIFHHIIFDGWSTDVFVKELYALYEKYNEGTEADLPPLALQFKDYASWEKGIIKGDSIESDKNYWLRQFEGNLPILGELGDQKRPKIKTYNGGVISKVLDKDILKELNTLCDNQEVSLFMVFLALTNILVYKNTGDEDVIIGSPIVNRDYPELFDQIGFYANTIALRTRFDGDNSFLEILKQVKENVLNAKEHQKFPLDELLNSLNIKYDPSRNPLFDIVVTAREEENTGKSNVDTFESIFDTITNDINAKFDLTFDFLIIEDKLTITLQYNSDVFSSQKITSLLNHLEQIASQVVDNKDQKISTIDCLTTDEKKYLLEELSGHQTHYPKDKTIVDLFTAQAKETPDAIAVVFEEKKLTYKELDERSNQLAHYLREQGVEPDSLVGICLERGLEIIVGMLGILKSGGAYVPVDPEYPLERIDYMLSDAGIKLVLSSAASQEVLKENEVSVLLLDTQWDLISGYSLESPDTVVLPNNLAYVIYTSGSTGNPKGVMIEHVNVVRLFINESSLYDFKSSDVWTLFHSFCFDFSVWEMYGALLFGGRLVIVPKATTKDAVSFKELLVKEGVTVLNQTPGSFYAFQEEFLSGSFEHSLRYVIFGGEALNPSYLRNWKETYPDCALINMYGITETTVHVTYKEITETDVLNSVSTIGSAIPTLGCYIVDADLNLVPIGVIGELCVGGAGVARGYLNREALTAEKFVKNPFEDSDFKLYKSGDLARWLPDGNLEYIGRKDNQVKIRGYRIELGEIENALSLVPQVKQCCVLAKEDNSGTKRLVGYVVLEEQLDKENLQQQLKSSLPDYMVPMLWIELESMPLTSNGKLDKKALPEPEISDLSTREYIAPRNEVEQKLAVIWQDLLGIEKIGIADNFFDLGGHSLKAVKMFNLIKIQLDVKLMISDLFENPTIERLSNEIENVIWANKEELEDVESENITI